MTCEALRTEVSHLRLDAIRLTDEVARLKGVAFDLEIENDRLRAELKHVRSSRDDWSCKCDRLKDENATLREQIELECASVKAENVRLKLELTKLYNAKSATAEALLNKSADGPGDAR